MSHSSWVLAPVIISAETNFAWQEACRRAFPHYVASGWINYNRRGPLILRFSRISLCYLESPEIGNTSHVVQRLRTAVRKAREGSRRKRSNEQPAAVREIVRFSWNPPPRFMQRSEQLGKSRWKNKSAKCSLNLRCKSKRIVGINILGEKCMAIT